MLIKDLSTTRKTGLINWVRSHDWGRHAHMLNGKISNVMEWVQLGNGEWAPTGKSFTDRDVLRAWAGY